MSLNPASNSLLHRAVRGLSKTATLFAVAALPLIAHAGSVKDATQDGFERRDALEAVADTPFGFGNGSFVVAPIPMRSPVLGTGLILGGGYLFQDDARSSTSFLGIAGLKTSNGTNGYGLAGKLSFTDNRWQSTFFVGEIDAFYDAFPLGVPVAINQSGSLRLLSGAYGFNSHLSAGLEISQLDTQIRRDGTGLFPSELLPDADMNIVTVNLVFSADYRDDSLYPTQGSYLQITAGQGRTVEGIGRDFEKAVLTFDHFISGFGPGVIATRITACGATDDTPFFEKCSIGGTDSFRGYNGFETLGNRLLSAQIEYRGQVGARFGYAVFGGFGNTADSFSELGDTQVRYAAGIGARYRLSKKFPMDLSVDLVRNQQGEDFTYIYVGQRF